MENVETLETLDEKLKMPEHTVIEVKSRLIKPSIKCKSYYKYHDYGDFMIIETPEKLKKDFGSYLIGRISKITKEKDYENDLPWIIQKIDFDNYNINKNKTKEIKNFKENLNSKWEKMNAKDKIKALDLIEKELAKEEPVIEEPVKEEVST